MNPRPIKHWSIIALSGPRAMVNEIKPELKQLYSKVVSVYAPDDMGVFPDTTGYTAENWQELEATMEDPALYPYMTRCMDAVMDYTFKKSERAEKMYTGPVQSDIHWPKFGGRVFAVTGHVTVMPGVVVPVHGRIIH